jgi:hypothetical protein
MAPVFFSGLLGQGGVIFLGERQLEIGQLLGQEFKIHGGDLLSVLLKG